MRYGEIEQCSESRTAQYCRGIDQAREVNREGYHGIHGPIRDIPEPGIPVCARSKSHWKTGADSGEKNRIYGQAIPEANPGVTAKSEIYGAKHKRSRYTGSGGFSPQRSGGWLRRRSGSERSNWNTGLTDWQIRKLSKSINF